MSRPTPSLSDLPRPPKAPGLPVLGQSFGFLLDTSALLDKLYRELGPAFRIQAGWNRFTVFAGKEGRDFLLAGAERHLTREAFFRPVGEQLGSSDFVLGVSGDKHERLRRILAICYSRQVASPFVPELLEIVRAATDPWSDGRPVAVMTAIHRIAYDLYTRIMMGVDIGAHYGDFKLLIGTNMAVGGRTAPAILYKSPRYRAARGRILKLMWEFVQARRKSGPDPDRPETIIDTLLSVRDRQGELLSDDEVVCYSMYGIAGSCSYMGRLLGFWLYELLQHPDALERVRTDVDGAFERGIRNATDLRAMTYLRATYHEGMRFHPVSQGLPFIAAEAFEFRGMRIEKGEQVVFSQIPMFRDAPPFQNPERFDPPRCMAPRNEHKKSASFRPFGMGKRSCTAQGLVETMAMSTMATLLHRYDLELAPSTYKLRMIAMPLPSPAGGFNVRVKGERTAASPEIADETRIVASFPGADTPAVAELLAAAKRRSAEPGTVLVRQGDPADAFYVVVDGQVDISKEIDGESAVVATLVDGQYFGETGLLCGTPRNASAVVSSQQPARLLVFSADQFADLVRAEDLVEEEIAALVRKRSATEALTRALPGTKPDVLTEVLPEFEIESFEAGKEIVVQGEAPARFYIVYEGRAEVLIDGECVAEIGPGEFFGEIGLLLNAPRTATVRATDAGPVTAVSTDRAGFRQLIDSCGTAHGDLALAMSRRILEMDDRAAGG